MAPSLRQPRSRRALSLLETWIVFGLLGVVMGPVRAAPEPSAGQSLQLEVYLNGRPLRMISTFILLPDGRLAAERAELEELGLSFDNPALGAKAILRLDDFPTLRYEYQERTQTLRMTVDPSHLRAQQLNAHAQLDRSAAPTPANWGGVLNYNVFAARNSSEDIGWSATNGATVTVDARAFSPYGNLESSGIVIVPTDHNPEWVRLDTTYRDSNPSLLLTWSVGDTIEGGLPWTRPIRLMGLQLQTNFALRPDLITMPMPGMSGVATVPSTLDVYVNNVRTWSQDVQPGPFSVSNVPLLNGAGNVSMVLRTAEGDQILSNAPIYASPELLAPGLQSWSLETGYPRLGYGSRADAYLAMPVGAATWRGGVTSWLTLEAHTEDGAGVANAGAGLAAGLSTAGVISAAAAASTLGSTRGEQLYGAFETQVGALRLTATVEHTFAHYEDLASATARLDPDGPYQASDAGATSVTPGQSTSSTWSDLYGTVLPARTLMSLAAGIPLPFAGAPNFSVSDIRLVDGQGNRSNPVTMVYSRTLPWSMSLSVSAFQDLDDRRNIGFSIGISAVLGRNLTATSRLDSASSQQTGTVEVAQSLGPTAGDFAWRLRDSEGAYPYREAVASYRSSYGVLDFGASDGPSGASMLLQMRGAVSTLGGDVFLSDRIDDAFAVVQTGMAGIEVSDSNEPIGITDARGMLLVPSLRAYQTSQISIDPTDLPADAEVPEAHELVAPTDRSGVLLPFVIRRNLNAALVEFVGADGRVIPAGASGHLEGGEDFVIGYDGAAFLRALTSSNVARISYGYRTCEARFDFAPRPGEQVHIRAVVCQ